MFMHNIVYAIAFEWPNAGESFLLTQPIVTGSTVVSLLGYPGTLSFTGQGTGLSITVPSIPLTSYPSPYAWVFKLENVL